VVFCFANRQGWRFFSLARSASNKRCASLRSMGFSFPRFHRLIASKADTLKERLGCDRVRFSVDVEEGHVSFKAKAEDE